MPLVTKKTPPQCCRFTYDGFDHVVYIIFTASLQGYSSKFTLKSRHNKTEKTTSYPELTLVCEAWINRCCDKRKVCKGVIDHLASPSSTCDAHFKPKQQISKPERMKHYTLKHLLRKNELMSIDGNDGDAAILTMF